MFHQDHKTARIGKELLPLEMKYLPEFFRKKGEAELNYTPSTREETLKQLKELIANDSTLRKHRLNDNLLLVYLNSRKYNLERTLLKLKKYLKYKRDVPFFFANFQFEELSPFMTLDLLTILPWRCQDGCAIGHLNLNKYDDEKHSIEGIKKMLTVLSVQPLRYPMTQINGFKLIIDLNIKPNAWRLCTPQTMLQVYAGAEEVLPSRVKEYHLVNVGIAGRCLIRFLFTFLPDKVKKRVHIHGNVDKLIDYFPRAVLPTHYGGDLKDYDMTEWLKEAISSEELAYFNMMSNENIL